MDKRATSLLLAVCLTALVAPTAAQASYFLYTPNVSSGDVSGYQIAQATGSLSPIAGSPFAVASSPISTSIAPDAKHLYIANQSTVIHAYAIDPATGALSAVAGSPFATGGTTARGTTISPDGSYLYAANGTSNNVSAFRIDASSGALSAIGGSPFATGAGPFGVAMTPDGAHLYLANSSGLSGNTISAFRVDQSTGALSPVAGSPFAAGNSPMGAAITPDGRHLYAFNSVSNDISVYAIDQATGALSAVAGSPFALPSSPQGGAVTPDGRYLYVPTKGNNVAAFQVDQATGALSAVSGTPFAVSGKPNGAAATGDGRYLYVVKPAGNNVSAFQVNQSTGALTQIAGSPFAAGTGPSYQPAATPLQGPTAALTASGGGTVGETASFDASASSDPDTAVASYGWDFGDGSTETTAVPTVAHAYQAAGTYSVTLTVTNSFGCSATVVFTGQTASCNGGSKATATQTVRVEAPSAAQTAPAASPSRLKVETRSGTVDARGALALPLACTGASGGRCGGKVSLKTRHPVMLGPASGTASAAARSPRRRRLALGKRSVSIAAGETSTVKVRITKRLWTLPHWRRLGSLKTKVSVTLTGTGARSSSRVIRLRLAKARG